MRAMLLRIAAVMITLAGGTVIFINWDTGRRVDPRPGTFQVIDRDSCTAAACGANLCVQADNILADAGSPCTTRFLTCDVRVGAAARAWAADAGLTLGPKPYQRLRFVGMRCPGVGGGNVFGIPMDDDGLPQFASVVQQPDLCVRAPLDGGTACTRSERDGGFRFYGQGNVFPAAESTGAQCESVPCTVLYGDNPDTDL